MGASGTEGSFSSVIRGSFSRPVVTPFGSIFKDILNTYLAIP